MAEMTAAATPGLFRPTVLLAVALMAIIVYLVISIKLDLFVE